MRTLSALVAVSLMLAPLTGCAALLQSREREAAGPGARLPEPTRVVLANGMTLLVVHRPHLPIVSINAVVKAGAVNDPDDKAGLASLTASLLKRGTTRRSAPQIAEAIDNVGGSLATDAGVDMSDAGVSVLKKDLDLGLDLLADVLQHPAFAADELKRLQEEEVSGLKAALDDANDVVKMAVRQAVLAGSPYGRKRTVKSLEGIKVADVRRFYETYYRPNNILVAVVGDLTPEQAKQRFTAAFGGWKQAPIPATSVPAQRQTTSKRVVLVDMDVTQSFVRIGHSGVKRNNPDYFPLTVMNFILGGDFTSRLNQSIRDRQGLAYGAGSSFQMMREAGTFQAYLNTKTESTTKALDSLFAELKQIQDQPVTAQELANAKAYLTGSFPLRFETNDQLAGEIVNTEIFNLPPDYLATYRDRVLAVTAEDVQRVARKYLQPGAYELVVVTKAKEVSSALAPYGQVELWPKERLIQ